MYHPSTCQVHSYIQLKRGNSDVCALWAVPNQTKTEREMSMRLLEDGYLATGEEFPIIASQLTADKKTSEC